MTELPCVTTGTTFWTTTFSRTWRTLTMTVRSPSPQRSSPWKLSIDSSSLSLRYWSETCCLLMNEEWISPPKGGCGSLMSISCLWNLRAAVWFPQPFFALVLLPSLHALSCLIGFFANHLMVQSPSWFFPPENSWKIFVEKVGFFLSSSEEVLVSRWYTCAACCCKCVYYMAVVVASLSKVGCWGRVWGLP